MKRFTVGLLLGSATYGIAWAAGASPLLSGVIGGAVAVICWFGKPALGAGADVFDDLT